MKKQTKAKSNKSKRNKVKNGEIQLHSNYKKQKRQGIKMLLLKAHGEHNETGKEKKQVHNTHCVSQWMHVNVQTLNLVDISHSNTDVFTVIASSLTGYKL